MRVSFARGPAARLVSWRHTCPHPVHRYRRIVIGLQDPTRKARAIGLQTLADHDQAELIQAAERGQVRAAEGSVRHVEVFQMGGVGTSILGRPRHLPRDRRASHHPTSDYTLNCEEPENLAAATNAGDPTTG